MSDTSYFRPRGIPTVDVSRTPHVRLSDKMVFNLYFLFEAEIFYAKFCALPTYLLKPCCPYEYTLFLGPDFTFFL